MGNASANELLVVGWEEAAQRYHLCRLVEQDAEEIAAIEWHNDNTPIEELRTDPPIHRADSLCGKRITGTFHWAKWFPKRGLCPTCLGKSS